MLVGFCVHFNGCVVDGCLEPDVQMKVFFCSDRLWQVERESECFCNHVVWYDWR